MKNKIKHRFWIVANFFGYSTGFPLLAPLHHAVALLALHGLGYDNRYGGNLTGENWFIKKVLPSIGDAACIDIGAHVGNYSAMLAKHVSGPIYAIEPLSSSFELLRRQTNPRIHPYKLAITDFDGVAPIYSRKEKGEDSTLRGESIADGATVEQIPVSTLDSFVKELGLHNVGFVKIDTEGHEMEVLSGMKHMLKESPPLFIQFEFNFVHLQQGHTLRSLTKLLPGYDFYRLLSHGMIAIDPEKYIDNMFMYSNFIAKRR